MPSRKKCATPPNSPEEVALFGISYVGKKEAIKELEKECKSLRVPLEDFLSKHGEVTSTGSRIVAIKHADKDVVLKHTLRVSNVLLPEAIDVVKKLGFSKCVKKIEFLDEDMLEVLYKKGEISNEDLAKIYQPKPTWAFTAEVKSHVDEKDLDI